MLSTMLTLYFLFRGSAIVTLPTTLLSFLFHTVGMNDRISIALLRLHDAFSKAVKLGDAVVAGWIADVLLEHTPTSQSNELTYYLSASQGISARQELCLRIAQQAR